MVKLSDAPIIILEGDEYFSSPIDMKAKFLWYKPHVAVITGIAWDHINVYPTKEKYNMAFRDFIKTIEDDGCYFYFGGDKILNEIVESSRSEVLREAYIDFNHKVVNGITIALSNGKEYPLSVFGDHNIQNMQAARLICHTLGINDEKFFTTISSFEGAANRLELLAENKEKRVFKDFAHSPSKLKATVNACNQQYTDSKLLAVMEFHTFSSLNKEFLNEYAHSLDEADQAIVYFSPDVVQHKKLENFSIQDVKDAFQNDDIIVITETEELKKQVTDLSKDHQTILLMSSGNFGGIDIDEFAKKLCHF
jgi:UDP-N-acetylmuramate: L-alanyl-gamma-D-glutamyl-meso-diaminopimelate ligase